MVADIKKILNVQRVTWVYKINKSGGVALAR
jgi:hypothetical protein